MKSKAYRVVDVNGIDVEQLLSERSEPVVHVGFDVGKEVIVCSLRWGIADFDRPWKIRNTADVACVAKLLQRVGQGRQLVVAMEPTGTYGDALRQALHRADVVVNRVSPKQASDYAEVFDGVPSQHDGKDAAVVAELAAQGKCWLWPMPTPSEAEQEVSYHVDLMDGHRRQMMPWCGRLEALLIRHWPEATRIVPLTSGTLLQCLANYGGPRSLAADPKALEQLRKWSRHLVSPEKLQSLLDSAGATQGMAMGTWDEQQVREIVKLIQEDRRVLAASRRRLTELGGEHAIIQAMGEVVGIATACVLWVELGDPRQFHCGPAYRKAMGLNLAERSSGKWLGKLKITKRGSSKTRRWLYLSALRWLKQEPVRSWYLSQVASRRGEKKPAIIGVMRKLALVLYQVGGRGEKFDRGAMYRSLTTPASATK